MMMVMLALAVPIVTGADDKRPPAHVTPTNQHGVSTPPKRMCKKISYLRCPTVKESSYFLVTKGALKHGS